MDTQKSKPGCNIEVDSKPHDINDTGYDEGAAKFMANPAQGFWTALKTAWNKITGG